MVKEEEEKIRPIFKVVYDQRNPLKKMLANKFISGVIIVIFGLLISWGVWVTNGVYRADKVQEVSDKTISTLCINITKLEGEVKEVKGELKSQRDLIHQNQEKLLEKLGGISKSLKSNDRRTN